MPILRIMPSSGTIFKIGAGPSSSHSMGPKFAAEQFKVRTSAAVFYRVTLFGSLAATGRGHWTDRALYSVLGGPPTTEIVWRSETNLPLHPNGLRFEALDGSKNPIASWEVYSVGGGEIRDAENFNQPPIKCYEQSNMTDILAGLQPSGQQFWQYVFENDSIEGHLGRVWQAMNATIDRGLASSEKILPGGLGVMRKAAEVFSKKNIGLKMFRDIFAYALACAEENAAGGEVVTAPTCGSCGVVPAVLRYLHESEKKSEEEIIRSLATAGLIGNLVRTNASISGAAVGCQGEIGTACAMAAAACCQLLGGNINQIEYAAEMGIEHLLGLTCDPIGGLVQIPCIERNIMAAGLALLIAHYALYTTGKHLIPFDLVVQAMKDTGFLMDRGLRETSRSGLARFWPDIVKEAAQQLVGTPGTS